MKISDLNGQYTVTGSSGLKSINNSLMPKDQVKDNRDLLQKTGDILGSVFGGKVIGRSLGTGLGYTATKIGDSLHGTNNAQYYDKSQPSKLSQFGDAAQIGLTIAAPEVGAGVGTGAGAVFGRIGANLALGAGLGAANKLADGSTNVRDIATGAAVGAGTAGGISGVGEAVGYLANNLPKWFVNAALPKMKNPSSFGLPAGTTPETAADYALNNTKGLSTSKMLAHSNSSVDEYSNQIKTILQHPEYKREVGKGAEIVQDVLNDVPNAQLDVSKVARIVKGVAPKNAALVDKVVNGTANLAEQNALRVELDQATKKIFTDHPKITFNKEIGHSFANALRSNVQSTAAETAPIFSKFAKELTLNNALQKAVDKKTVAGDLLAGGTGFAGGFAHDGIVGGIKGAAEGILIERGLRSPTARIIGGKVIQKTSKILPTASKVFQGIKAPLVNKATGK